MTVFGKSLSDYVRFQRLILIVVAALGLLRLGLSLAGVPNATTRWLSMTAVLVASVIYYGVKVHTSGFGSYRHLLPLLVIQSVVQHGIAVLGLVIAIATGQDNVFSAPEYSGGGEGKTWVHAGAHVWAGMLLFPLALWLVAAAVMFVTKKVSPGPGRPAQAPAA